MRCLACGVLLVVLGLFASAQASDPTALDAYVATPDSSFSWSVAKTLTTSQYTAYWLSVTSQTWAHATNDTTWDHYVQVVVPKTVTSNTALLRIFGGRISSSPPTYADSTIVAAALQTNSITVGLPTVPNQPLYFADEPTSHTEDEIVAYTFAKYMETGDSSWVAYLPMVNSAVRTMDAVQQFTATLGTQNLAVQDFVVTGFSKRGWTTWLTAAVDPKQRVKAIIPTVADLPNLAEQMEYHREHYQDVTVEMNHGYSTALNDYVHYDVLSKLDTAAGKELLKIVDPANYFDRTSMSVPKYILSASGDEFFTPGSASNYLDQLQGPTYLRYVPNAGHDLNAAAIQGALNFYEAVLEGADLPEYSWKIEDEGTTIVLQTIDEPLQVLLWQADNPESHDFRYSIVGDIWKSTVLTGEDGLYRVHLDHPLSGARAFYLEMLYLVGDKQIWFSTSISVLSVVPEPATWGVLLLGGAAVAVVARRRRTASKR